MDQKIQPEAIRRLAELSRLSLTATELSEALPALEQLLGLFDDLRRAPVLEPQDKMGDRSSLREDRVPSEKGSVADAVLAGAPEVENFGFQVPAVLGG